MTITYSLTIKPERATAPINELPDVYTRLSWIMFAVDNTDPENPIGVEVAGSAVLPPPEAEIFIDAEEVDGATLKSWLVAQYSGDLIEETKAVLNQKIADKKVPPSVEVEAVAVSV